MRCAIPDQGLATRHRTLEHLRVRGLTVEVLPTDEAVRRFGELQATRTAAALYLTCWAGFSQTQPRSAAPA